MYVLCSASVPHVAQIVAHETIRRLSLADPNLDWGQFPVFVPKEIAPVDTKTATT